ncbi:12146_t:CDS:2, partial [Acaulospora morrowiae]
MTLRVSFNTKYGRVPPNCTPRRIAIIATPGFRSTPVFKSGR